MISFQISASVKGCRLSGGVRICANARTCSFTRPLPNPLPSLAASVDRTDFARGGNTE